MSMVLILDGNSEIDVQVGGEMGYSTCIRHLCLGRHKCVSMGLIQYSTTRFEDDAHRPCWFLCINNEKNLLE